MQFLQYLEVYGTHRFVATFFFCPLDPQRNAVAMIKNNVSLHLDNRNLRFSSSYRQAFRVQGMPRHRFRGGTLCLHQLRIELYRK
jgi:hypothetical protein